MQFQLAVSNASSGPWTFTGPDGTGNTYFSAAANTAINLVSTNAGIGYTLFNGYRYFRYRVNLLADSTKAYTPTVNDIVVNWSP